MDEQQRGNSMEVRLAIIQTTLDNLIKNSTEAKDEMRATLEKMAQRYVNIDQFTPVKLIVYGLVATTLGAVLTAVLYLVISNVKK